MRAYLTTLLRSRIAAFAATALLAACGHLPGAMGPVSLGPAASSNAQMDMLVATTRRPSSDPGTLFTGERSPRLHITDVAVSIPPRRKPGEVRWPRQRPPDPATEFAVTRVRQINSLAESRAWFHQHVRDGHAIVFIHGFNNRYQDSVFRFSQIVHDSGMSATPILFTWLSRARLSAYEYDKESTNYSRTALEQSLRLLADDPNVRGITVLAHSMGTWLAMESLRQMGIRDGRISPKIQNVILASPDIDIQVFSKQFEELGPRKPNLTIFVSQDDRALALSSFITGRVSRLGAIDPSQEPYRSRLEAAGVTAIDLTQVRTGGGLHHGKFAESPEIVRLIGQRLMAGQTLTDSRLTLGEGVAVVVGGTVRSVGDLAGAAAAAPIAVFEEQKRERY